MQDYTHYTEQEIWRAVAEGNETAFIAYFNREADTILSAAKKIVKDHELSRDIVQEVFVRAWLHRSKVAATDKPTAWLLKTTYHLCIDSLRRMHLESKWLKEISGKEHEDNSTDQLMSEWELSRLINQAVQSMPAERKKIYLLSREQGLDRNAIATELGISPHTVKNQLTSALRTIQEYLQQNGFVLPLLILANIFLS